MTFQEQIKQGIPSVLPEPKPYPSDANRAPKRKDILSADEKQLAIRNALRYFPKEWHKELAAEFAAELKQFGRIYMYRFKPNYELKARSISDYPAKCEQAAAIMLMIDNNLDPAVAQHPEELITYGGNGAVFQNWAQYLLTMKYLSEMEEDQTLHMYSGHPMGLFPSSVEAPRVVVTNGMMIPNYSKPDDWEKFNALGVTQYGQMTAGSFMYIGPQGIVHGTTITVMNAFRKVLEKGESPKGKIFLTAGLGGMSGAQPKAGNIANCITVCAEVNPKAAIKRHQQGWVDELIDNMPELVERVRTAQQNEEVVSIAFIGNVVDVWESFLAEDIFIHLGSDQTSLHNPWSGGYYPVDISYEESNRLIREEPEVFKEKVQATLKRHADAVNNHTAKGTYFFDYGNAFLLEASRAGGDVMAENGIDFKYPSYVQDILGPMCFDYGFGPFRWVCTSGKPEDLDKTDAIAADVLNKIMADSPEEIQQQMQDNITWIKDAKQNKLVVGSQARILYADAQGRAEIAKAFNDAINRGEIGPVVLGRDHHDVSGTDSPFRETSNIYDGSRFTADMAIHNVIGDGFRGATWVSIHNGGGVGWGEVINGGFGMLLDGSEAAERRLKSMLLFDVNNGIARRSWARNEEANFAIKREMARTPKLKVTLSNNVDDEVLSNLDF
ncbi:urocanate hydratase [Pseudoalteromonas shioyasakiensis]|uniref:Urocanate hydratase n=1 Tax=Pseudoalteromonas shioyasakiensis TaxID=1190813 RepID=A0ABT6TXN3_9GAMM|nr:MULTISPECIES: urocanate hydratase [Pseudoalteromonas]MDI4668666.1 urocanate hydratase [Pseudoalteromonas shioyasakiensis]MDI4673791.1 urocanate hydratase [Pseudoalteromonas shioyasakiensis]MDI4685660.1 urocanate hydratase [Pseudoalteromonas shioyasakiensis]MDI4703868.1 urocanate hydratase [Pseudoalteromonas shioyasakiensis]NUJ20913.1 urocanate hydratase [Pseudoalteromonas sp. 0802]